MSNYIEHKGYIGTVEYSKTDDILHGEVLGIRGLITYEGNSLDALKKDFEEAIESHLVFCEEKGVKPQKPYSGNLNDVKISPNIHKDLAVFSAKNYKTMNEAIEEAIRKYIAV